MDYGDRRKSAAALHIAVVEILQGMRPGRWNVELGEWEPGELEEEIEAESGGGQQGAYPRIVIAKIVWRKLQKLGIWEGWEFVEGYVSSQEHAWFEMTFTDKVTDPLPQTFLVDPCPVKVMTAALPPLEPGCPFLILYKKKAKG